MNRLNLMVCMISLMLLGQSSRVESQIYSIHPDGTGLKVEVEAGIEPGLRIYGSPDVSPNGERLIFDAFPRMFFARFAKILVVHLEGESQGQAENFDCGNFPVWSPDGKRIAFQICAENPLNVEPGVWLMDADGDNAKRLSDGKQPRWSPDGKSVICTFLERGVRFAKVDVETNESKPFLDQFQHEEPIRFSSNGTRVLAHVRRHGKSQLISMAPNGAEDSIVELSDSPVAFPVFSPNGKWVAFASENAADGKFIQIVATDGQVAPKKLTFAPAASKEDLCWHPDGKRILFISDQVLKGERP